jgi:hypothetical protein
VADLRTATPEPDVGIELAVATATAGVAAINDGSAAVVEADDGGTWS